jgi:hypothetical protein
MAQHPAVKALIEDIEEFKTRMGMTATRFGQLSVGDGNFIRAIKTGRTPSLGTIDKVRQFMKSYKRRAA